MAILNMRKGLLFLFINAITISNCIFGMVDKFSEVNQEVPQSDLNAAKARLEELLSIHDNRFHKAIISLPPTDEFTDAIFPRTDAATSGKIYKMLAILDYILTRHNIPYWIDGGVLLGAVRHQGLIPWDDDGDIEVFASDWNKILSLESEFKKFGYEFRGHTRLWPINQNFPFVDIVLMLRQGDKVVQLHSPEVWPDNWFYESELFPGERLKFGPITLHAPSNPERYLKAHYGDDCLEYALCWQHQNNGFSSPLKVKIVDFNPAPFVLK